MFPTFIAPSFGEVHTGYVKQQTCARRKACDCIPDVYVASESKGKIRLRRKPPFRLSSAAPP